MTDKLTTQTINNSQHTLNLIRSQIKTGSIDQDFILRQLDKIGFIMDAFVAEHEEQKQAGQFEALYNVSRVLGTSLDLQTVLDQVMDAVIQLTGAERGFLMLRDDDGGLRVVAARNFDQETLSSDQFKFSRTFANTVLDQGMAVVTTNAAEDPRFSGQMSIISQALRSIMATPLFARGNVIGIAYVDSRALVGLFGDSDLNTLEALSGQAAVAIDNAILFSETDQELSHRVEVLQQLRRIDMQLSESLDADKTMQVTLEWACRFGEAKSGHIGLITKDDEGRHIVGVQSYGEDTANHHAVNLDEMYPSIWKVIDTKQSVAFDSGQYGVETILAVPIRLGEDKVIGVTLVKRDNGESFSDEQSDLIERIVTRAAVAIENAQLYAAVQEADRAKSEFVGIVAHDLKSPMTSIAGYSDLMLMTPDKLVDRQEDFLKRIRGTVKRMEILVSDLADIARIETGHFFMDEMEVTVGSVIEAVRDGAVPEIENRNHTYVEEITDNLPDLKTDYYRLVQVLTNLVSNAYKYTPDGGTITLTVRHVRDRIEFSVSDTGIGLSPEAIKNIGKKFWRSEDNYTRSQPGTGLGFSITRSLIEQMGSEIRIKSEEGKGSSFSFGVAVYDEDNA
jgi:signal transduction histidine kinase